MSENCSGDDDCGSEGDSSLLISEKGRNKRKFLSDMALGIPVEGSNLSLTEFPRYEMLDEKFRHALNELGSMMERSEDIGDEQDIEELQESDWDDPVSCQLEELLTKNLFSTFSNAVKKIVERGYSEEVAEWAVLNSSLFHGSKDALSNVVDGALALLKKEKEHNTKKHPAFDGLQSLVDYTLLEMIYVLREVRPSLTVSEAMWCLLISDLNLVNACVEGGPVGASSTKEAAGDSKTLSQSKLETSGASQSKDSRNLDSAKQIMPHDKSSQPKAPAAVPGNQSTNKQRPAELASPGKESPGKESSLDFQEVKENLTAIVKEHIRVSSQGLDEKSGGSRKGLPINLKRDMLRQKAFQFEKNYKGCLPKGALKARVAAWGSMVLDKSLRSQSSSSSVAMKGAHSDLATSAGPNNSPVEGNNPPSSNLPSLVPASSVKNSVFALPTASSKTQASVPDANRGSKGEGNISDTPKAVDFYAAIPFDETLQKYVPQDEKDEAILVLVPHKEDIEKEIQGWTEWANEKVMQAARRLGKDKAELKMLRQEKEEMEKFKKEKQTLEESTMKRLSEMESALTNATGQIEVANCNIRRLEAENDMLKNELEVAKVQAVKAGANLEVALEREQENLKKLQSWDAEKSSVQEKLTKLKRDVAALNNHLGKARERQDQFKALLKQEEKEKLKVQKQIDSIRRKLEEEAAQMKVEADSIKQAAEKEMQKCEDDIKNLQKKIRELRLESDKSKIAALNMGFSSYLTGSHLPKITKRLAVFENFSDLPDVKPERECVMCMTEEISVVFLPCAHQVLCGQCNVLHEKQGMSDCPSCRSTIQKRISVTYRAE